LRGILFRACAGAAFSIAAWGGDAGVPPRTGSGDYPVHGNANAAVIAAAVVPPDQVSKMFSSEIAKRYVVVEVAIYPGTATPFDAESSDFSLKTGRQFAYTERPQDVTPWQEKRGQSDRDKDVTTQAGVIYERSKDPVYGTRQTVGTYSGVAVTDHGSGQPGPPPSSSGPGQQAVYDRVQRRALPEGQTRTPIAGYLYFPKYGKSSKTDSVELQYSKDGVSVSLVFPK
jgi:hypothetical protein